MNESEPTASKVWADGDEASLGAVMSRLVRALARAAAVSWVADEKALRDQKLPHPIDEPGAMNGDLDEQDER